MLQPLTYRAVRLSALSEKQLLALFKRTLTNDEELQMDACTGGLSENIKRQLMGRDQSKLQILLFFQGGISVGWVSLDRRTLPHYVDFGIYVDKGHRNSGLGSVLFARALRYIRKHYPNKTVMVYPHGRKSKHFFSANIKLHCASGINFEVMYG